MAEFSYNLLVTYTRNGNSSNLTKAGTSFHTGTLTDDDGAGDVYFQPSDPLADSYSGSTHTYIGTYTYGGQEYAVAQTGGTYYYYAYSDNPGAVPALPTRLYTSSHTSEDFGPVCFGAGTLIATPGGERTVETLRIGDLVTTADGRAVPVKWIGRQSVHKIFTPAERFAPVRIPAGALGDGLPHADLVLTADHALILDGIAVNAGALVDGATIAREPMAALPERVTYYHVETEAHEIILANGVPAETYVDYVARRAFDNHQEYVDLYGAERTIAEMPLPRVSSRRQLPPQLRRRLDGRRIA